MKQMSENIENPNPEEKLEKAGDALGEAMARQTPEIKSLLRTLKEQASAEFDKVVKEGSYMDRALYFAALICENEEITDDDLLSKATDYIDATHDYMEWLNKK